MIQPMFRIKPKSIPKIIRFKSTSNQIPNIKPVDNNLKDEKNLTPEQLAKKKQEAAELAMQSIKDIGGMFSLSSSDKETEVINTKPVFQNPKLFDSLNLLHQGQIIQELQEKYDKSWKKLNIKDKKLGYYIAYGNWGPREKFDNWKDNNSTPFDLPFESRVNKSVTIHDDKISKLPERDLRLTPVRKDQFNIKKLDSVTKFFIYLTLIVIVAALYRDKFIGEDGKPTEVVLIDVYEEQRLKEEEQERLRLEEEEKAKRRKWYYLWLK